MARVEIISGATVRSSELSAESERSIISILRCQTGVLPQDSAEIRVPLLVAVVLDHKTHISANALADHLVGSATFGQDLFMPGIEVTLVQYPVGRKITGKGYFGELDIYSRGRKHIIKLTVARFLAVFVLVMKSVRATDKALKELGREAIIVNRPELELDWQQYGLIYQDKAPWLLNASRISSFLYCAIEKVRECEAPEVIALDHTGGAFINCHPSRVRFEGPLAQYVPNSAPKNCEGIANKSKGKCDPRF